MKIACLTFTGNGEKIAEKIKKCGFYDIDIYKRDKLKETLSEKVGSLFKTYDAIVFISSTGIAVRLIAPYIEDKTADPAVVVVDDLGRFSISLLSGHLGGANELAEGIAKVIGALPVITTASDGRGIEAVDMFAKRCGFVIDDMNDAKIITSMMIEGKRIKLECRGNMSIKYNNLVDTEPDGFIVVTEKKNFETDRPCCILRPRILNVGLGCRRGKSCEEIINVLAKVFDENNLSLKSLKTVCSIDIKKDEIGIIEACRKLGCDFKTFTGDEIERVQDMFKSSDFVKRSVGVASVAEPCAYLAGGKIIIGKIAVNGITAAVSREEYNG